MHKREENCGQNGAKDSVPWEVKNQGPLWETFNNSVMQNGVNTGKNGKQKGHTTKGLLSPAEDWTFS